MNLLEIDELVVSYQTSRGRLLAVDGLSLALAPGETLGLVGESGCGKSSLGKAIVELVAPSSGAIRVEGRDLATIGRRDRHAWRSKVQMIFQDPMGALDPRHRAETILEIPLKLHGYGPRARRLERVIELMEQVGLRADLIDRRPHEFSGGQRQRLGIARALALNPKLIVCDEPVSALDLSLQAQVLNLLRRVQRERNIGYLFISHDLSVVEHISDRIAIMYLGKIVEVVPREALGGESAHPYTQALMEALPRIGSNTSRIGSKNIIGGDLPSPYSPPKGCRFHTRCPLAFDRCKSIEPRLAETEPGHFVACHLRAPDPTRHGQREATSLAESL